MLERKEYAERVFENYERLITHALEVETRILGLFMNQVDIPPAERKYDDLAIGVGTNRKQLLRNKLFLDAVDRFGIPDQYRPYVELLREGYWQKIQKESFKDPYCFILTVPYSQWGRYKTEYWPKPRILPQLLKEAYPRHATSFKLLPRNRQKVNTPARRRGYTDKGSRAPEDVVARRRANEEYQAVRELYKECEQVYSRLTRTFIQPEKRKTEFLRWFRTRIGLPKNTTLEITEELFIKLKVQALRGE